MHSLHKRTVPTGIKFRLIFIRILIYPITLIKILFLLCASQVPLFFILCFFFLPFSSFPSFFSLVLSFHPFLLFSSPPPSLLLNSYYKALIKYFGLFVSFFLIFYLNLIGNFFFFWFKQCLAVLFLVLVV